VAGCSAGFAVSCLKPAGEPLCTTCRLGGLIRCPMLGTPLPLVEGERAKVIYRGYFWASAPAGPLLWSNLNDPTKWK
jgi:hypothetical protein